MTSDSPTRFRLRSAYGLRMLGAGCVLLALAVACWIVRSSAPSVATTVIASVVTAVAVVVFVTGAALAVLRPPLLTLDDSGLANSTGRGVGVRRVAWADVAEVSWSSDTLGYALLIALADGTTSRIHVAVLDADPSDVENAVRTRADTAHGYHPL